MVVLHIFGSRIATILDLSVKRHSRVTVCCAGPSKVSKAGRRPKGCPVSLDQNARKAHHS